MTNYPYMSSTGKLKEFLDGIRKRTVPEKVTQDYLSKAGFASKSNRPIIKILKFIGFLDKKGIPTNSYKLFRDTSKQGAIMARSLRQAYSNLFEIHNDACRKDNEALTNFFRTETGIGEAAVNYMIQTFKTLCSLADFSRVDAIATTDAGTPDDRTIQLAREVIPTADGLTVNLNIQLVLPTTENIQIYESIFKLLKEHVLKRDGND